MKNWEKALLAISLITWVICQNYWLLAGFFVYHFGTAQMILVSSLIIHRQPKISLLQKFISSVFLFIASNNLADELFFDPLSFEINEYVTVCVYIIYVAWKVYRRR